MYRSPLVAAGESVKKDGARNATVAVTVALVRPLSVITIFAVPGEMSEGTRKLTCVLLTKSTGAASPLTETPTPPVAVGSVAPVTFQVAVAGESPLPSIATHVFGAITPGRLLPAFKMLALVK